MECLIKTDYVIEAYKPNLFFAKQYVKRRTISKNQLRRENFVPKLVMILCLNDVLTFKYKPKQDFNNIQ